MTIYCMLLMGFLTTMIVYPTQEQKDNDLSIKPYIPSWIALGITLGFIIVSAVSEGKS